MKERTKNILRTLLYDSILCIMLALDFASMECFFNSIEVKNKLGVIICSIGLCLSSLIIIFLITLNNAKEHKKNIKEHKKNIKEHKKNIIEYLLFNSLLFMICFFIYGVKNNSLFSIVFSSLGLCCFTFLLFFHKKLFKKRRRRKKKTVKKVGSSEKDDSMENVDSSEKIDSMENVETLEPKDVS